MDPTRATATAVPQTKLRALSRPMYRPPEGFQIADINKAWVVLEASESDHDAALVEEIKRLTRLEQVRPARRRLGCLRLARRAGS